LDWLKTFVRRIPDFPGPGVVFMDLTPLLGDARALRSAGEALAAPFADAGITRVAGIEARGFVFGTLVARELGAGFVPLRKPGKLPAATESVGYTLEYGQAALEIHRDAISAGERVLLVDDVLATGGTALAALELIGRLGGQVAGFACLLEISALGGRDRLPAGTRLHTVLHA
jgi:adenine phosphoribosyltransferase